ncbi:MAG: NHL repeat-containing protein [Nitrospirae bacterium]|nr:NHL repeat-containing protein [Nitrospirota bacterium]
MGRGNAYFGIVNFGGGLKLSHWGAIAFLLLLSTSCIRKSDQTQSTQISSADEGIALDVGIPLSPEIASALTGVEEDAEVDVFAGDELVAEGVRGGVRAGVRGGIRASEQSGVRGGVRGGVRASSQGGVRAAPARQAAAGGQPPAGDENTIVYQFTFQLPVAHARDGANNIRSRVRSRKNKDIPFVEVTATVTIKVPPPPDPSAPPGTDATPAISFQIEETPIPINQVVLPDVDGDGVSSLVEVATAKATTGSIEQALAAAADATIAPTQEQVVAAFTQLGKTLEKNLKDSGVTVKVDLEKIDVTPPDTTATLDRVQAKVGEPITVATSCSKSNCVYRCTLDEKLPAACPSPFILNNAAAPLPEGPHALAVRAADALGNTDQTPVVLSFTVLPKAECGNKICESGETEISCPGDCDKVPPNTSIAKVESVHGADLTGLSVTNQEELRITLTCTKSACTFECAIAKDGQFGFGPCANPATPALSKGDGEYTFRARAKDANGNVDPTPAEFKITLDKTPPETTINNNPPAITNQKSAAIGFSCTEPGTLTPGPCSFLCQLDTGTPAPCSSPFTATNLGDGTHTFTVAAADALGNPDATPAGFSWVVDTVLPGITLSAGPPPFTNANRPSFTFSSTDSTAVFECHMDNLPFNACTSPVVPPIPLLDGAHTFEVRAADPAGNVSGAAQSSFTVDTVLPTALSVRDGLSGYTLDQDIQSDTTKLAAWWNASSDAGSGLDRYEVAVGTTVCTGASPGSIMAATSNSLTNSITKTALALSAGTQYFVNVMTFDKAGNVRCDSSDGIKIGAPGLAIDVLGHLLPGDSVFYTAGGPNNPRAESFDGPGGLVYDTANDRLFASDSLNNRVLVFNCNSTTKMPLDRQPDFVLGQSDFVSTTPGTSSTKMNEPRGLTIEYNGATAQWLYVADHLNHRVLIFNLSDGLVSGEAAANVLGQGLLTASTQDWRGDAPVCGGNNNGNNADETPGTNACGMCKPIGLAVRTDQQCDSTGPPAGSCLFVSEYCNHRITMFNKASAAAAFTNGAGANWVFGQAGFTTATQATTQTGLKFPRGLALSTATNKLYVADSVNNRVTRYDVFMVGNNETADGLLGQSAWNGAGPGTSAGTLRDPRGLSINSSGTKLFVSEGTATLIQGRTTVFSLPIACVSPPASCPENAANVLGQVNFTASGGNTTQSGQRNASDVLHVGSGANQALYVADSSNNRLIVYDPVTITDGEPAVDLAGQTGAAGVANWSKGNPNNADDAGLYAPWHAVVDTVRTRMFVADSSNNRVLVFNLSADNVLLDHKADAVIGQPTLYAASAPNASPAPASATNQDLNYPGALAIDEQNGKLFVADSNNNRVLVFDVSAALLSNYPTATNVIGQTSFAAVATACSQTGLNYPFALAFDPVNPSVTTDDRLFVSDNFNNRVMVYSVGDGILSTNEAAVSVIGATGGTPFADLCPGSGTPNQTQFNSGGGPCGVALDGGTLFVSDANNNRVLVFNVGDGISNGAENAINVLGQANFTSGGAALTQSGLSNPEGLAADPAAKRLYVADDGNNRILVFDISTLSAPPTAQNAVGVIGQTNFTLNDFGTSATLFDTNPGDPMTRLSLTGTGTLLMGDAENNRILAFPVQ